MHDSDVNHNLEAMKVITKIYRTFAWREFEPLAGEEFDSDARLRLLDQIIISSVIVDPQIIIPVRKLEGPERQIP